MLGRLPEFDNSGIRRKPTVWPRSLYDDGATIKCTKIPANGFSPKEVDRGNRMAVSRYGANKYQMRVSSYWSKSNRLSHLQVARGLNNRFERLTIHSTGFAGGH
jgi:hypothetical protein